LVDAGERNLDRLGRTPFDGGIAAWLVGGKRGRDIVQPFD